MGFTEVNRPGMDVGETGMERGQLIWILVGTGALALMTGGAMAADDGQPMSSAPDHTFHRAGNPQLVSRLAGPGLTRGNVMVAVGGGAPAVFHWRKSAPAGPFEGTMGMDWSGRWFHRHVDLRHAFAPRYQGGAGSYATHERRHVPNVFNLFNARPEPPGAE